MKKEEKPNLNFELFTASCQLRGLSELYTNRTFNDVPLDAEECAEGIASILRGIGEKLRELSTWVDEENVHKARKRRSNE